MVAQGRKLGLVLAIAVGAAGFVGCRTYVHASATGTVVVEEPTLVLVRNVWVVEGHSDPVFYESGLYWRWYGGVWYRSQTHTSGWVRVETHEVPQTVVVIERPEQYAHYTAPAGAEKRRGPPDHAKAHGLHGTQPGHNKEDKEDKDHGGGPPDHAMKPDKAMKEEKPGQPEKEEKPGKPVKVEAAKPAKEEKPAKVEAAKPAKEEKPAKVEAAKPAKEPAKVETAKPAKQENAPPAKEEKAPPAKEDKKGKP